MNNSYLLKIRSLFKGMQNYISWSAVVLASGFLLGVSTSVVSPVASVSIIQDLSEFIKGLDDLTSYQLLIFIFFNNTIKGLAVVVFGVLFAIFPVVFLLLNGFVIGLVTAVSTVNYGWLFTTMGLLPHGIFEITALLLTSSIGMMLGVHFIRRLKGETDRSIIQELLASGRFFVMIIVPLFLIAAIIEALFTEQLTRLIVGI